MESNIPPSILAKIGKNLYLRDHHPLNIIKNRIYAYFGESYAKIEGISPIVSVKNNFDVLLVPKDHPCRSVHDTYYVDKNTVLRTQMTAHQVENLLLGTEKALMTGDVYRKDEIDSRHYPVFHQMDGYCVLNDTTIEEAELELKRLLGGLVETLFPKCEYRFNKDYFPFTDPSFEVEVMYRGNWLEILGCGIIRQEICDSAHINRGIAWGLGLERLAMILFDIPDIRKFWCEDQKFLSQFEEEKESYTYVPYSSLENVAHDISFFLNVKDVAPREETFDWILLNNFYELIREVCGDNIAEVNIIDKFYNARKDRYSMTFRLVFSPSSDLKNGADFFDHTKTVMESLRKQTEETLSIELR